MRVNIHPSLFAYLLGVCVFSSPHAGLAMAAALAGHELSHYAVARALREPVECLELAPFGGVMTYAPGRSASKGARGVFIAAAGPLGNYAMILLTLSAPLQRVLGEAMIRQLLIANLSMIIINLMPALPLDGGVILFSVGYYLCGVSLLIAVLCGLGVLLGTAMAALAAYGVLMTGKLNLSLLVVGGYLIVCARRSKAALLTQNVYTVVQERIGAVRSCKRITAYRIPGNMSVLSLLPWIARSQSAVFFVDGCPGNARRLLDESAACRIMLDHPQMTVADAAVFTEKTGKN